MVGAAKPRAFLPVVFHLVISSAPSRQVEPERDDGFDSTSTPRTLRPH